MQAVYIPGSHTQAHTMSYPFAFVRNLSRGQNAATHKFESI